MWYAAYKEGEPNIKVIYKTKFIGNVGEDTTDTGLFFGLPTINILFQ